MKLVAELSRTSDFSVLVQRLGSPQMVAAAASGLNEHASETRRQTITRVSAFTGVPAGRVSKVTKVKKARPGGVMIAEVVTADKAIGLEEYGNPHWVRDLNPVADGKFGGSVSSMAGAEATAWNRRRVHRGTFFAKGVVWKREPSGRLRKIFSTVLANEVAKPGWRNVLGAEAFVQMDLERRVVRHVLRVVAP
ncbi:hypothetical protein JP75_06555 [Devosia riboflavina]|uniref:Uncharacterized protein n=1 Tax=Devosia riboflavina TaxID=46914 RepID=A0A087M4C3_9HYPH|nr:hypothetical protein [Devosia riboflavina]KFL31726.1 hypothetical protein JP75_06555 [Devosia riboflavina]